MSLRLSLADDLIGCRAGKGDPESDNTAESLVQPRAMLAVPTHSSWILDELESTLRSVVLRRMSHSPSAFKRSTDPGLMLVTTKSNCMPVPRLHCFWEEEQSRDELLNKFIRHFDMIGDHADAGKEGTMTRSVVEFPHSRHRLLSEVKLQLLEIGVYFSIFSNPFNSL